MHALRLDKDPVPWGTREVGDALLGAVVLAGGLLELDAEKGAVAKVGVADEAHGTHAIAPRDRHPLAHAHAR